MNSALVAWRPILLVMALVLGGLWATGHPGLALASGAGFFLLMTMLLTGNLPVAGLVTVVIAVMLVGNFTGHLHYDAGRQGCIDGYHWTGPWRTVWAVGRLEFRIHEWYCAPEQRYDPKTWHTL